MTIDGRVAQYRSLDLLELDQLVHALRDSGDATAVAKLAAQASANICSGPDLSAAVRVLTVLLKLPRSGADKAAVAKLADAISEVSAPLLCGCKHASSSVISARTYHAACCLDCMHSYLQSAWSCAPDSCCPYLPSLLQTF